MIRLEDITAFPKTGLNDFSYDSHTFNNINKMVKVPKQKIPRCNSGGLSCKGLVDYSVITAVLLFFLTFFVFSDFDFSVTLGATSSGTGAGVTTCTGAGGATTFTG